MLERMFSKLTKDEADRLTELKETNDTLQQENKSLHAANGDLQMLLRDAQDARDGWKEQYERYVQAQPGMVKYGVPPEHFDMPQGESYRTTGKVRERGVEEFTFVDDNPDQTEVQARIRSTIDILEDENRRLYEQLSNACKDESKEEFYRKTIRSLRRQLQELATERKELLNKMKPKPSPTLISLEEVDYLQGLMMDTVGLDGPDPEGGLHDLYQKLEDMKSTIQWRDQQIGGKS